MAAMSPASHHQLIGWRRLLLKHFRAKTPNFLLCGTTPALVDQSQNAQQQQRHVTQAINVDVVAARKIVSSRQRQLRTVRLKEAEVGAGFGFTVKGQGPVRISRVKVGSPAEEVGLRSGDVIERINGCDVLSLSAVDVAHVVRYSTDTLSMSVSTTRVGSHRCRLQPRPLPLHRGTAPSHHPANSHVTSTSADTSSSYENLPPQLLLPPPTDEELRANCTAVMDRRRHVKRPRLEGACGTVSSEWAVEEFKDVLPAPMTPVMQPSYLTCSYSPPPLSESGSLRCCCDGDCVSFYLSPSPQVCDTSSSCSSTLNQAFVLLSSAQTSPFNTSSTTTLTTLGLFSDSADATNQCRRPDQPRSESQPHQPDTSTAIGRQGKTVSAAAAAAVRRVSRCERRFVELTCRHVQNLSRPLRHQLITADEHSTLFQNVEKLLAISEFNLHQLKHFTVNNNNINSCTETDLDSIVAVVESLYSNNSQMFTAYKCYVSGFNSARQLLEDLHRLNPAFNSFVQKNCCSVEEFILTPLRHLSELELCLSALMRTCLPLQLSSCQRLRKVAATINSLRPATDDADSSPKNIHLHL